MNFNNIIGFPWEKSKHFNNTLEMNKHVPKDIEYFATACTPIPYPGSGLYDNYCEEFGFKEWWLDNRNHEELPSIVEKRPFYMNFMPSLITHDMKVNFWNYSSKMKKEIVKTKFKIQFYHLKGKLPIFVLLLISSLCRISAFLDTNHSSLERFLFYPISKRQIAKLAKKYNFVSR